MFPTLIDLGTFDLPLLGRMHLFLPTYGVLFATAALVAWWWFQRRARVLGLSEESLFNLSFYTLLGGIVGAKLTLVAVDWRLYLAHPGDLLGTLRSAGVLMGGVIAGGLTFVLYARRRGMPLGPLADAAAAPLALAQGIGRLGCFCAGCCWGVPARGGPSVTFTLPAAHEQTGVPLDVPLVPTQLFQAAHDLLLATFLAWLWRRRPEPVGTVGWTYVLLYAVGRSVIELWRGDRERGLYFGETISTSQLIGIAATLLAAAMLVRGRLRRPGPGLAAAGRTRR
jgi:phosphatidylglycerol:prolipoprotein diacylglycerol transferase